MSADASIKNKRELLEQLDAKIAVIYKDVKHDGAILPHETLDPARSNMIRMQRAISWLHRDCELQTIENNFDSGMDISFILHWIAFESLYGKMENIAIGSNKQANGANSGAVKLIMGFFANLEANDMDRKKIVEAMNEVWDDVVDLFNNPFIDPDNWVRFYKGRKKAGPKHNPFGKKPKKLTKAKLKDQTQLDQTLKDLFQRLYMLRNQLFHGNATHKGHEDQARSSQIVSGAHVLSRLLPVLIGCMLDAMELYKESPRWKEIPYPRIRMER